MTHDCRNAHFCAFLLQRTKAIKWQTPILIQALSLIGTKLIQLNTTLYLKQTRRSFNTTYVIYRLGTDIVCVSVCAMPLMAQVKLNSVVKHWNDSCSGCCRGREINRPLNMADMRPRSIVFG